MITDTLEYDLQLGSSLSVRETLIAEVRRGLLKRPRSLAPWMFYDARGSRIFEQITKLQEYYPTRTESNILSRSCDEMIETACPDKSQSVRLVELGAGTAAKTVILLDAAVAARNEVFYVPVDVSSDALQVACETIASSLPQVYVDPLVANYVIDPPQLEPFSGTTVGLYIGSSIGNFSPEEARTILRNLRGQLQPGDALLLGTDLAKDESILVAAYDDREGVTSKFNLNMLHRLNRELGANFNTARFQHRVLWNPAQSRIEMHLESTRDQVVNIPAARLDLHFEKGERIHTENSRKFTNETIGILLRDADFEVEQTWTDDREWYAVTLARVL